MSLPWDIKEPLRRVGGKMSSERKKVIRRTQSTKNQLSRSHTGSERLTVGAGVSLTLWPALTPPFLLLGCLVQPRQEAFVLSYYILFCPVWPSSLGDLLLSKEEMEMEWI